MLTSCIIDHDRGVFLCCSTLFRIVVNSGCEDPLWIPSHCFLQCSNLSYSATYTDLSFHSLVGSKLLSLLVVDHLQIFDQATFAEVFEEDLFIRSKRNGCDYDGAFHQTHLVSEATCLWKNSTSHP